VLAGWSVSSYHISVTVQNQTHVHMKFFCLESHILSFPKLLQIPPESPCICVCVCVCVYIYIYINYLTHYLKNISDIMFADDIGSLISPSSHQDLIQRCNLILNYITQMVSSKSTYTDSYKTKTLIFMPIKHDI